MGNQNHDQALEAMLKSTGEWAPLHSWCSEYSEIDADGWLERFGDRIGSGTAPLPDFGYVDLSAFCAVRRV